MGPQNPNQPISNQPPQPLPQQPATPAQPQVIVTTAQTQTLGVPFSNKLEEALYNLFVKIMPGLPPKLKDSIVSFAPWLIIGSLLLMSPILIAMFTAGIFSLPVMIAMGPFAIRMVYATLATFAFFSLQIIAIPGLFKQSRRSWQLLFYAELLMGISDLSYISLVSVLTHTILPMYILFQVRERYSN